MKVKKVLNFILELITSPFSLLLRSSNDQPNPNKVVKPIIVFVIAIFITALIIILSYGSELFGW
ncbi:MAG: hypothetical protein IJR67_02780 [Acholeplasmatales bacterium]|nr:hypothetical protein [Acholeplasmatales bacterium]